MLVPLLQAVEDDGVTINEGTVIWVLLVVLLIVAIVYVANRIR